MNNETDRFKSFQRRVNGLIVPYSLCANEMYKGNSKVMGKIITDLVLFDMESVF